MVRTWPAGQERMETSTSVLRVVSPRSRALWLSLQSSQDTASSLTREATTTCKDSCEQGSVPGTQQHNPHAKSIWLGDHRGPDKCKYPHWSLSERTGSHQLHRGSLWQLPEWTQATERLQCGDPSLLPTLPTARGVRYSEG